jgi:hypothetical protein
MLVNESIAMKRGLDCLNKNFETLEVEMIISAIIKSAYDYTNWRQGYFANAYLDDDGSQLKNFLDSAAAHDPYGVSFGIK